jgi:LmbE family N-acetylglucosaminyl deacetylase
MKPLDTFGGGRIGAKAQLDVALARAPIRDLRALVGEGPIFVLAPHPDDEAIACGGLLAAAAAARVNVVVHILTDGRHSHPGSHAWPPHRIAAQRRFEAQRAATALRLRHSALRFGRHVDGTLIQDWRRVEIIAEKIAASVARAASPTLIAPWRGDLHPDHMAASAIADLIEGHCPRAKGLRYLVWARQQAHLAQVDPARIWRFPIHAWRARKRAAIRAYRSQTTRLVEDVKVEAAPLLAPFLGAYEPYLASDA